jgi:hypothetical protein
MLRKLIVVAALVAASIPVGAAGAAAEPIKDCDTGVCTCGEIIAVGYPGKDPIFVLRVDC